MAYRVLRATLHALRDRLTVEEAAQLAAQTAMQSAIDQQNSRASVVAQPVQAVQGGRVTDGGPTMAPKRSK